MAKNLWVTSSIYKGNPPQLGVLQVKSDVDDTEKRMSHDFSF